MSRYPQSKYRFAKRLTLDAEGASAVEFAMVMPFFLMVVFAVVIYGLYFAGLIATTNAASEGARASVAGITANERQTLAANAATNAFTNDAPFLNSAYMTIASQNSPTDSKLFQVSVTYDFSQYGLGGFANFVPLPNMKPTVTIAVAQAGAF